jgi:GTP pyrophosphokinase
MADHHVNILSCQTATGADRVCKMRFDFDLADPGHLSSVIASIKGIDSVYDAYRVLPGKH